MTGSEAAARRGAAATVEKLLGSFPAAVQNMEKIALHLARTTG